MNNNITHNKRKPFGVIYKLSNSVNGKVYIGQTVQSLKCRFADHRKSHTVIGQAIRKYGVENFEIRIIDNANTVNELNEKEIYWIKHYNSISPNGYNLCAGGGGTVGYRHKQADKLTMNEGKKISFLGKNNPFYGKTHSEEQRRKWSEERKGRDTSKATIASFKKTRRKVINIDDNIIYDSVEKAAQDNGLKATHISRVCRGKRKRTGGIRWMYLDDYKNNKTKQLTLL